MASLPQVNIITGILILKVLTVKLLGNSKDPLFGFNKYFFKTKLNVTTTKIVMVIHARPGQIFFT